MQPEPPPTRRRRPRIAEPSGPRPPSTTAFVAARIREDIIRGRFAFGERLSEQALAAMLGTSKTPVREGLLQLQSQGLVRVVAYSGTYVFDISERDLDHLSEMRAAVEGAAIRAAMARQPGALLAALEESVAGMAAAHAAGDNLLARAHDAAFHAAALRLAGNPYLTGAYAQIEGKLDALRCRCTAAGDVRNAVASHRRILAAVRRGDQERASGELSRHVRDARDVYRQILAPGRPAAAPA